MSISSNPSLAGSSASASRSSTGQAVGASKAGASGVPFTGATIGWAVTSTAGNGACTASRPTSGEQLRHWPSVSCQQFAHVYWRHDMQKLKVLWNASSWRDVTSRSASLRAAAIASSIDESSDRTKLRRPLPSVLSPRSGFAREALDSNV